MEVSLEIFKSVTIKCYPNSFEFFFSSQKPDELSYRFLRNGLSKENYYSLIRRATSKLPIQFHILIILNAYGKGLKWNILFT